MQRVVLKKSAKNLLLEVLYDPVIEAMIEDNIKSFIGNFFADHYHSLSNLKSAGDRISVKTHVIQHVFNFIQSHKKSWHNQTVDYFPLPSSP
jgi:hypothetical protein